MVYWALQRYSIIPFYILFYFNNIFLHKHKHVYDQMVLFDWKEKSLDAIFFSFCMCATMWCQDKNLDRLTIKAFLFVLVEI